MIRRILLAAIVGMAWGVLPTATCAQTYGGLPDSIPDRYSVSGSDLLTYADSASAVVRLEAIRLSVEDPGTATMYERRVVTVFGKQGRHHGRLQLFYDSFVEIEDLEGRVLNAKGETIKELDDEDVHDRSGIGGALYTDARRKIATLYADTYPYTVEYRYEKEITVPMRWPTWYPQDKDVPVEFGQFQLEAPPSLELRHRVRGGSLTEMSVPHNDRTVWRWRVRHRPAYEQDPLGPTWREQAPSLLVGATTFEVSGTRGDMGTWAGLAEWYGRLKDGRDELPPRLARRAQAIVSGAESRRDSVRRLYRHMQRETRYVNVQLGIGGWQPFPASYVEERGYGDCKALTNYMEASLESVGIPAYPVLIRMGNDLPAVLPDFPSNQFNHVVLAVPMPRDTLWLENTDSTAPFGHVHARIEDRYGLLVRAGGGELVRTPASAPRDNRQVRTAVVQVHRSGSATASVRTTYTGNQQDRVRHRLVDKTPRERKKWLRRLIDVPSFDLNGADFSDVDAYQDTVRLPVTLGLPQYASKTGSRLFLPVNLMQQMSQIPPERKGDRLQPIHAVPYPFVDIDSIRYDLPEDFDVEAMPGSVSLETDFATYQASVERTKQGLLYRRRLEWREKALPPEAYEAVRRFLRKVADADQAQAVVVEGGP